MSASGQHSSKHLAKQSNEYVEKDHGWGFFFLRYTGYFILVACFFLLPFVLKGKQPMWMVDGLEQTYVRFAFFGKWVREALRLSWASKRLIFPQWSLSMGFGEGIFSIYAESFVNPFYYISVFIPSRYSEWGFDAALILRMYCAGLAFALFAREKEQPWYPTLLGSVLYAFSGWTHICLFQFGFVDILILFPLLLYSTERLFKHHSPVPFIVVSAFLIANSTLFAFMSYVLLVPYCILLFMQNSSKKGFLSLTKWFFTVVGLIAVAFVISCPFRLPAMLNVLGQSRLGIDRYVPLFYNASYYVNFLTGFLGYTTFEGSSFSGGCFVILACILVFSRKGNRAAKLAFLLLTAIAVFPIASSTLNGFQYPTNRWMWAYALCLCYFVTISLPHYQSLTSRDITILIGIMVFFGIILLTLPITNKLSASVGYALTLLLALWLVSRNQLNTGAKAIPPVAYRACILMLVIVCAMMPVLDWGGISKEVDAGKAWAKHTSSGLANALKKIDDDSIWRYDYFGFKRLRNNSLLTGKYSFDVYTSYYDERIDGLFRDLEISDEQTYQSKRNLTGRSYLEAAFGAKYFVIEQHHDDNDKPQPELQYLPYGASDKPVVETKSRLIYENNLALPLAYTFSQSIDRSLFDSLTATEKQQALLQAVALEDGTASSVSKVEDASGLSFDDLAIPYEVSEAEGVKIDEGAFLVSKKGSTLTLTTQLPKEGELYVELKNLTFENNHPKRSGDSLAEHIEYLQKLYRWEQATDYVITFSTPNQEPIEFKNRTRFSHMYAADNTNIINLGLQKPETLDITVTFNSAGRYSFEDFGILLQPVTQLESFVSERRTSPTEVSLGVNEVQVTADCNEDQLLLVTIPLSKGWTALVDGQKADLLLADGAFMALDLPAGTHDITLKYETPGLKIGLCASLCAIAASVVICKNWERFSRSLP